MTEYPSYQETNCDWIGQIPSDWKLIRGRFLFKSPKELNRDLQCDNLLSLTLSGVLNKDFKSSEGLRPDNYNTYQIFQKDDLVFKMIDLENVNTSRVGIVHEEGIMSPVYLRHEPIKSKIDPKFAYWFYYDLYKKEIYNSIGIGVRSSLTSSNLLEMELPVPSIEEQKLISRYLDKKTKQIDSLIEKIQKKIELLKEQRTSLINQCVTKGLDPNVEMKDSGIEWIGEIPSNWILSKFGFVASLETGNTPSKSEEDLYFTEDQNGFLWVKPSDLDVGFQGVSDSEVKLTFEGKEQSRVIPKDSILVCCIGNTSGKYSIANCDLSTNQQINSITFKDQIFPRYGLYYMDVFGRDLLKWMNFVTLPIISKGDLSQQPVIVPPKSEQIEISEILDKIISEHKVVTELHLQKIQLLKEYRQSLISSVVTGKVRVTEDMV